MPYFDHNATSPLRPEAQEASREAEDRSWANPSSLYQSATEARQALAEARAQIAAVLGTIPEAIVFTSGATESNHSLLASVARQRDGIVLHSPVEHASVLDPAKTLLGNRAKVLSVDNQGQIDPAEVHERTREGVALVSVLAANNETGVIQPLGALREACGEVPLHLDATQWWGREDPSELAGVDYVTASAHKFGGPRGVGFLKIDPARELFRGQRGGAQEQNRRAGTENVPGILGMVAALAAALREREELARHQTARDHFEGTVTAGLPGTVVVGGEAPRLAQTSMLLLPRHPNTRWVTRLDRHGFAASTGSACATGQKGPSPVLTAMGYTTEAALRAVRFSAGWTTARAAWEELAEAILAVSSELDAEAAATTAATGSQVIDL